MHAYEKGVRERVGEEKRAGAGDVVRRCPSRCDLRFAILPEL